MTIKEYINEYNTQLEECRKKVRELNDKFCKSNVKFVKVGDVIARTKSAIIVDDIVAMTNIDYDNYSDYWRDELLTKDFDDYYDYDDFPDIMFVGRECKKDGTIINGGNGAKIKLIGGESDLKIFRKNADGVYEYYKTTAGYEDFRKDLFGLLAKTKL